MNKGGKGFQAIVTESVLIPGVGCEDAVSMNDMHTCLIDSYRALKWIKKNTPSYKVEIEYRNLRTLDQQMALLKPYLQNLSLEIEDKFYNARTWSDVQKYAEEEWRMHGNGVVVMWMQDVKEFGHAVPVIEGKIVWGDKTCGFDLVSTFGSNFYCKYIFVDTFY